MSGSRNNPGLKEKVYGFLKMTPSVDQRLKWQNANKDYLCTQCVQHGQPTCVPSTDRTTRCTFCTDNKAYCTRVDEERHATIKELLGLDDQTLNEIKHTLEEEGRYVSDGVGPVRERGTASPSGGTTPDAPAETESEESITVAVPPRFVDAIKTAQLEARQRTASFNSDRSEIERLQSLRGKFASEMSKRGSVHGYASWNNAHPFYVCASFVNMFQRT
ncbi:hypothetical protein VKT23_008017 [Stygiomarasmius scandens]|uniref:Uncharacterized protein n=1 Tax=Marasmiellus scandens TaxID=2682957 RepID=A0ABR1JLU0_9AGAR